MRKAIVIAVLIICLAAAYGYAQTDEGMGMPGFGMPGSDMMDEGMGAPGFGMPGADMSDIMPLMNQMASMMRRVSSLIPRDMDMYSRRELAEITSEMSDEMSELSRLMGPGGYDPGQLQDLRWRMRDTEDRLRRLR
jgi:hypothetical protein